MDSKISKKWLTKLILIMAVFILVASALSCTCSSPPSPPSPPNPELNKAPDFTLSTLAGDEITLSELEGPVVLNFWATWCVYCAEEMRYFNAVAKQSADEITVVAIDVGQDASKVKQYFGDYEISFTVALDEDSHVASMYAVRYFPTTFFIDSEGVIRNKKIGAFRSEMELWDSLRGLS